MKGTEEVVAKYEPSIRVFKRDETEFWNFPEEMIPFVKRVVGIYIFDASLHVFCCEMTPSYDCRFVQSQLDLTEACPEGMGDAIYELICKGDSETDRSVYFHVRDLDTLKEIDFLGDRYPSEPYTGVWYTYPTSQGMTREEALEEVYEDGCGNGF